LHCPYFATSMREQSTPSRGVPGCHPLRAPEDYRPGSRFLRIRAEADKARYARELLLSERAREVLDEVCPEKGILFLEFAWRYPLRTAATPPRLMAHRAKRCFLRERQRGGRRRTMAERQPGSGC
jgi:hypothetical protein